MDLSAFVAVFAVSGRLVSDLFVPFCFALCLFVAVFGGGLQMGKKREMLAVQDVDLSKVKYEQEDVKGYYHPHTPHC